MRIEPIGKRILVSPVPMDNYKTESGIDIPNTDLCKGVIVEVSNDLKELYFVDEFVLYPEGSGQSQYYKNKSCVWLNTDTEIWGKITNGDDLNIDSL